VVIVDNVVTINPSGTFESGTGYYVQIDPTCFDDSAGNSYAGITDNATWNFSTITIGNLIAYYPFNGNANDESGNGNHGTVHGATLTHDLYGSPYSAYSFDGIDDYIKIPDSASFNFNYPITLSAWIYLNDNSKGGIVGQWGYGGLAGDAFLLYIRNTKLSTYLPRPGELSHYELQSNNSLVTNKWYFVSMVSTGSLVTLYINGNEDKSEAVTVEQVDSEREVIIGLEERFYGTSNYFNGIIDEVRIYNHALSASEIQALYAASGERYEFVSSWGSFGTGDSQFNYPFGITVDSSGYVYVAEPNNHRIQKFTSSGTFLGWWGGDDSGNTGWHNPDSGKIGSSGNKDGQFNNPHHCIAVDSSGHIYVADSNNNRIQKFTSSGTFETKWGSYGTGDSQFNFPIGIAVDSSGYVYVAEPNNHRIQKFTSSGTFLGWWGLDNLGYTGWHVPGSGRIGKYGSGDGQLCVPEGITVDSSGYIYVADTVNHRIQKFSSSGDFITKWGSDGSGNGQFHVPAGIAVDSSGYVYVADSDNNRVQKFKKSE